MNLSNQLLSNIVHYRTYARYLQFQQRRELFEETVNRTMTMHLERFPKLSRDIVKAFGKVHELKVLPSMRSLQFSGEGIIRNNVRQFNCFSRETEFVTDQGIKSFCDYNDGDIVNILSDRGFLPGVVKNFGEAPIFNLYIQRQGSRKEVIQTTDNHRWLTVQPMGTGAKSIQKLTCELQSGDILKYSNKLNRSSSLKMCSIAVQHGMVFGDGTKDGDGGTTITLCGDSTQFVNVFTTGHIVNRGIRHGKDDGKIIIQNLPYSWKSLPPISANKEYLLGFLCGWFAADGSIGINGSNISLSSSNKEHLLWARGAFAKLNIFTKNIHMSREFSPFDGSRKPLYQLTLNSTDLFKDFFLKINHKNRFNEEMNNKHWIVDKIEQTNQMKSVWCIQEPTKEMFTLANGIVTKNCSFSHISEPRTFAEILFVLLSGCGAGYSVQKHHVNQLPTIRKPTEEGMFVVHDSIMGWADALEKLCSAYFYGAIRPIFDFSQIRPKGSYLVTTGAKAPGPEPLKHMLEEFERRLQLAIGRQLKPIEVHDLICISSDCVIAGGIRRSALIALFDRDDQEMLNCKTGEWWLRHPYRARANNSAVLPRAEVTEEEFISIFEQCHKSGAGEPGFFFTNDTNLGTNPCCEISLNNKQFCNLTVVNQTGVVNKNDFMSRIYSATLIGTLQAAYTTFPYLSEQWKKQTESEALLGVSFTGIADSPNLISRAWLREGAELALAVNERYAKMLGINIAARVTTVKPEGTSSTILGSSSGIHARHSEFYLRRIRINVDDALAYYLKQTIPELVEPDVMAPNTLVVTIPQQSPGNAIIRANESALKLLDRSIMYNQHWIKPGHRSGANRHNVSCTISVKDNEWDKLGSKLWEQREKYNGISLLPFDGGTYQQAPFEECTKEKYEELSKMVKVIDLRNVIELEDNTKRIEMAACAGGLCSLDV